MKPLTRILSNTKRAKIDCRKRAIDAGRLGIWRILVISQCQRSFAADVKKKATRLANAPTSQSTRGSAKRAVKRVTYLLAARRVCFKCKEKGHDVDCYNGKDKRECLRCKQVGHVSKECPRKKFKFSWPYQPSNRKEHEDSDLLNDIARKGKGKGKAAEGFETNEWSNDAGTTHEAGASILQIDESGWDIAPAAKESDAKFEYGDEAGSSGGGGGGW